MLFDKVHWKCCICRHFNPPQKAHCQNPYCQHKRCTEPTSSTLQFWKSEEQVKYCQVVSARVATGKFKKKEAKKEARRHGDGVKYLGNGRYSGVSYGNDPFYGEHHRSRGDQGGYGYVYGNGNVPVYAHLAEPQPAPEVSGSRAAGQWMPGYAGVHPPRYSGLSQPGHSGAQDSGTKLSGLGAAVRPQYGIASQSSRSESLDSQLSRLQVPRPPPSRSQSSHSQSSRAQSLYSQPPFSQSSYSQPSRSKSSHSPSSHSQSPRSQLPRSQYSQAQSSDPD